MPVNLEQKFFSSLDTIRSKPKVTRQTYAFGFAAGITGAMVLVWVGAIVFAGYYPGITSSQRSHMQTVENTSAERFAQFKNEFAQQVKKSPERERVKQLLNQIEQERNAAAVANSLEFASTTAGATSTETATTTYGTTY